MQLAFVAVAWTVPVYAAPGQQLKPALQAIDPSKLQTAPLEDESAGSAPASGSADGAASAPGAPNPQMEQLIPEFGKPDPTVPPSMARPMPPGPGWTAGYAPAQQPPGGTYSPDVMQANPNAPDDPRVAKLEQIAFGSTYPEHDTDDRIEHLEREAFGKVFPGDNESRMQRLLAKYSPQGAFSAPPTAGQPRGWTPQTVAPTTAYRPQPPQYQPQAYQQQPAPGGQPQAGYAPPAQQGGYAPPSQQGGYAPPSQQGGYAPPAQQGGYAPPAQQGGYAPPAQQGGYAPPQQTGYAPPSQPAGYAPPQQTGYPPPQQTAYAPPQQPYYPPPPQGAQPSTNSSAPPSIPSGPVTMGSFNRQQNPYAGAPPSIPTQPYQPPAQQQGWQQPPQQPPQGLPYPPNANSAPPAVAVGAPPGIPQGPVTMGSFNRQAPPQQRRQPPALQPQQQPPQQQQQAESQAPVTIPGLENLPPYDKKAGDYSQQVIRLGGSFARWTTFPVRVHIPMNTQENWRAAIDGAVKKWSQFVPVIIAPPNEPADIEVGWINHLMPRQLGITNLEIFNGRPRVTIYLLRPSYYPPDVTESSLQRVALHEIGHGLGLFGHSSNPGDAMFALDTPVKSGLPKTPSVSARDVNTLRKIYESQPLPEGFQSPQPISWP